MPAVPGSHGSVAIVTDSTASLAAETASARGIAVVPLQVVVGDTAFDEGRLSPQDLADALRAKRPVSTSRPNPEEMLRVYERLAAEGAAEIVSIHLSADLSGTFESAQLAASRAPVPVALVDTRQVGMGTGYAVLSAADAVQEGADADRAAEAARRRAAATTSLFYVDTLEYLRRGGRVGAVGALVGSALAVKPILSVDDGTVRPLEKVRTAAKALSRLEQLAVDGAGTSHVDVAIAHLDAHERAEALAARLTDRLADQLGGRAVDLVEIGAVLGAHAGPGLVAVAVAPRL